MERTTGIWIGFLARRASIGGEGFVQHVVVHEQDGAEGLVLGGGADVSVDGQVGEELFDFGYAHLGGMAFMVEEDKAFAPLHVRLFGADRVMFEADFGAQLVKQF